MRRRGRLGLQAQPYPQRERLAQALRWAQAVDTAAVAAQAQAEGLAGARVGERIHQARVAAVAQASGAASRAVAGD